MLEVTGEEETQAYGKTKLYRVLAAGIEGGIYTMYLVWIQHYLEEEWGFIIFDAGKNFN